LGKRAEILLVYTNPLKGIMVDIQEHDSGKISVAFRLNSDIFTPEDPVFQNRANAMKIDPQFLHAIIIANAPQSL